jgi:hypothetical protein
MMARNVRVVLMRDDAEHSWFTVDHWGDPSGNFPMAPEEVVETAGDSRRQAHTMIVACDTEMRSNYQSNHITIGRAVFPLLYSEFTPEGGRYTLLVNDSARFSASPTPPIYEEVKSIAHIPLGVWSIVSRYFAAPGTGQWVEPLERFGRTISAALSHLSEASMPKEIETDCRALIDGSLAFIRRSAAQKSVTIEDFEEAFHALSPEVIRLQTVAAATQVHACLETLNEWKKLLGDAAWSRLYAVVSAQWTLSTENVHQVIIGHTMSNEQAQENILVTSRPLASIEEARALVGRVVGDRVMAGHVLSTSTEMGREDICSLSTSRDLISQAAEKILAEIG